jgi:ribonuclease HI
MSSYLLIFIGFIDSDSRHTRNLASTTWFLFSETGQLVYSGGTCLGPSTNNIIECSAIVELLSNAISHEVQHIVVFLDSQLAVSQLNDNYRVRDLVLL